MAREQMQTFTANADEAFLIEAARILVRRSKAEFLRQSSVDAAKAIVDEYRAAHPNEALPDDRGILAGLIAAGVQQELARANSA